ncbi:hypothetical protein J437_LFUL007282 [Ladona fulva]|uniref:Uncharacterized protein n=1 Tax=Ladona fulva TaxID=123851 RepID=A0A8K0K3F4_LADFU|nr:hypothetical protein J437_LFUL007282 [Ladona fulva]
MLWVNLSFRIDLKFQDLISAAQVISFAINDNIQKLIFRIFLSHAIKGSNQIGISRRMANGKRRGDASKTKFQKNKLSETIDGKNGGNDKPGKDSEKEPLGFYDPKSGEFNFKTFLYNSKKKTILGRRLKRWGICFMFYLCFYTCLAIFWGVMLFVHLSLIYKHEGPWIAPQDVPYFGPGLSYVPPSPNIDVVHDSNKSIKSLDEFLSGYQKLNASDYEDCRVTPSSPENCFFDVTTLGECAPGGVYGYDDQKPCIILKFNRAYGMKFDPYRKNDELPNVMPVDLKYYIKATDKNMNKLWLSCEGHRDGDKEALNEIRYWPDRGYENYYYPFLGHSKHLSPLVAIKVSSKKQGVTILISCQLWAKNLSTDEQHGSNTMIVLNFA